MLSVNRRRVAIYGLAGAIGLATSFRTLAQSSSSSSSSSNQSEINDEDQSGDWKNKYSCYKGETTLAPSLSSSSYCMQIRGLFQPYDNADVTAEATTKADQSAGEQMVQQATQDLQKLLAASSQSDNAPSSINLGSEAQQLFSSAVQQFQGCVDAATSGINAISGGSGGGGSSSGSGAGFLSQNDTAYQADLKTCGDDSGCKTVCKNLHSNLEAVLKACEGPNPENATIGSTQAAYGDASVAAANAASPDSNAGLAVGPGLVIIQGVCQNDLQFAQCLAGQSSGSSSGSSGSSGSSSDVNSASYWQNLEAQCHGQTGASTVIASGSSQAMSTQVPTGVSTAVTATDASGLVSFPTPSFDGTPLAGVSPSDLASSGTSSDGSSLLSTPASGESSGSNMATTPIASGTTLALDATPGTDPTADASDFAPALSWDAVGSDAQAQGGANSASASPNPLGHNSLEANPSLGQTVAGGAVLAGGTKAAGTTPWTPVNQKGPIYQINPLLMARQQSVPKAGGGTELVMKPLTLWELGQRGYHGLDNNRYVFLEKSAQTLKLTSAKAPALGLNKNGGPKPASTGPIQPASLSTK